MKHIHTKHIITAGAVVLAVYLAITYRAAVGDVLAAVLTAATPLFVGAALAFPLNILMTFYERHFFPRTNKTWLIRSRRGICLAAAVVTLVAIVAAVVALILPQLISCVTMFINLIPGATGQLIAWLKELPYVPQDLVSTLSAVDWQSTVSDILRTLSTGLTDVATAVIHTVTSVISGVMTAFLSIIFAVYLLAGKDRLRAQGDRLLRRVLPARGYDRTVHVLATANVAFRRFIIGQCTEAVILGSLCCIGMLILGLPYAPMIGALTAFCSLIPIVGTFTGAAIAAFILLMNNPWQALVFLIFFIILQQLEGNLIYPRVVGSSIGLPGIWVLAAVLVGGGVLGIGGMLVGIPLTATVYHLIQEELRRPAPQKPLRDA